jgi:LuxR family quorum-sensing system transcriptional regulator CciR
MMSGTIYPRHPPKGGVTVQQRALTRVLTCSAAEDYSTRRGQAVVSFSDLERFVSLSRRVSTAAELKALMETTTSVMGFDHFALLHHQDLRCIRTDWSHLQNGTLLALHNYPEEFARAYIQRNWVAKDPILLATERRNVGFRWRHLPTQVRAWRPVNDIAEEARLHGIIDGYTVPANIPGEPKGSCSFAVRVGRSFPEENLLMAETVGAFAFQAARDLLMSARHATRPAQPPLTERQLECLVLVAKGKSDWEIAQILGIGSETVKHHVRMARERYGVPTRVQAAIRAIFESNLGIDDILS